MSYVKVTGGTAVEYTIRELREDNPRVSFPSMPPLSLLATYDVYEATEQALPSYDPYTQSLARGTPVQVGDDWQIPWVITSTPENVVTEVSMSQARRALLAGGYLDSVDPAIAAISDATARKEAEIQWEYATVVRRSSALVTTLGTALGLSEAQIDALFIAAAQLD